MAWRVRLPDGTLSRPFDTASDAEAHAEEITAAAGPTPEEIWARTTAARVTRDVFLRRMATGWTPHRALHTSMGGRYLGVTCEAPVTSARGLVGTLGGRDAVMHEAFGRTRTLTQWSEGTRLSVSALRHGIRRHGSLEAYLTHKGRRPAPPGPVEIRWGRAVPVTQDALASATAWAAARHWTVRTWPDTSRTGQPVTLTRITAPSGHTVALYEQT